MERKWESRYWNEEIETLPWDSKKKSELQLSKLKKLIKYCYDTSPLYYKRKFDEIGLRPEDIRTWEDFRNLPILGNKEEERKSQEESVEKERHPYGTYLCTSRDKVIYVTSTGGTTGAPTFSYLCTEDDIKLYDEALARVFWWVGLRPGDTVANIFAQCMHWGGLMANHHIVAMGLGAIPVGAEAKSERILRIVDAIRPKALFGTPPLMENMIERCPEVLGKQIGDLGIKILLCGGAPGAGIAAVRKKLEDTYGAKVFDFQPFWVSCDSEEYYGMHFLCPDMWIYPEDLADPETNKPLEIKDGVIGQGLMTFFQEAKPMLKYGFGDLLQVFTKECPGCGFKGLRVRIVGRADEMLMVKGMNVYPTAVKGVVNTFFPRVTGEMRIVLEKPGPSVDPPMKIHVEHTKGLTEKELVTLKKEIEDRLHGQLEFRADITLVPPETFERAGGLSAKGALIEKRYKQG